MSEGIVKAVEQTEPVNTQPVEHKEPSSISTITWEGIPVDYFRFFSTTIDNTSEKEVKKLKDVYEWSMEGNSERTLGNGLSKLSTLTNQLGAPRLDETSLDRVWRWVIMKKRIDELRKRQGTLEKKWL